MLFRRKNYFTKKGFQSRFVIRFLAASLAINAVAVILFIFLAKQKIDDVLFSMKLPATGTGSLLFQESLTINIAAVVSISILFLLAARSMYHKIEGPLLQIRTDIKRISLGDLGYRVIMRETDEFKDFADEINTMTDALGRRYAGMKHRADDVAAAIKVLENTPTPQETKEQMQRIKDGIIALREQIGAIRL